MVCETQRKTVGGTQMRRLGCALRSEKREQRASYNPSRSEVVQCQCCLDDDTDMHQIHDCRCWTIPTPFPVLGAHDAAVTLRQVASCC